jgi:outer membrane protein
MKRFFLFALMLTGMTQMGFTQKFGHINTQTIFEMMPEYKQANSDLDVLKQMFEKKGQEMVQVLQAKYADLQKKQQTGMLAPIELEKQAAALKSEEEALGTFEKSSQEKIYAKTEELLKPIQDKFNKALTDVAKENGFAYIFDSSAGLILYSDASTDATAYVKTKLGIVTP